MSRVKMPIQDQRAGRIKLGTFEVDLRSGALYRREPSSNSITMNGLPLILLNRVDGANVGMVERAEPVRASRTNR